MKRPGLRVRARQGFFGPFDTSTPKAESADPLVMSALSPFGSGGITVRLTSMFAYDANAAKAGSYVRSLVFIDPGDLHFDVDQAGKHTARFQVLVMAVGDNGRVLDALAAGSAAGPHRPDLSAHPGARHRRHRQERGKGARAVPDAGRRRGSELEARGLRGAVSRGPRRSAAAGSRCRASS